MHDTFTRLYRPASRPWYGSAPGFFPPWRPDAPFHIPPEPRHDDRQFGMGPPNSCHSRRSTSPLAERRVCNEREGYFFAPKQQLQQPRPVRNQMKEDQLAGQATTVKQQELSEAAVPKDLRLPQPPNRRTVPDWVEDCFGKDEYALLTEEQCNIPFLREGVVPKVGMMLYLQMTYKHDGSHPQHYRSWGRMVGEITHVCDPPEVGVYAVYDGQEVRLSPQELQEQRNNLLALPPSLFGQNATCECCRTAEQVVEQYGAVHGQRVKGKMWLMKRDSGLEPQLGGVWDIELVANDNLESMWVLCAMSRQDNEQPQEQLPRQRQHQEQQQAKQAQKQAQQHEQQQQTKQVRQQAQQQAQQLAQPSPQSRDTRGDESGQDQQQRPQSVQPASPRAQMEQQKESQVQGNEPPAGRSAQQQQQLQQPALFYRRQQPQKHQQGEPCQHGARQAKPMAQQQQPLLRAGSDRQYDTAQQQEQHVAIQLHDRAHSATCQQQPHNRRKQQDWGREQGHYNQQQQQQHDRDRDRNREQRQFDQRRESYTREQQRERHDREQRQEHINPQQQRQAHEHQRQQQPCDRQQRDHVSQPQRDREQQRGYKRDRNGTHVHDHGYQDSDRSWQGREHNREWNHKQERDWDYRDRKRSVSSGSGRSSD